MMPSARLWSVVHSALLSAIEKTAKCNKAKTKWLDGDGFLDYKGTIDINSMSDDMAEEIGAALDERENYERLKAKFGDR